MKLIEKEQ